MTTANLSSTSQTQHRMVGATITRVYYAVPSYYTIGETFEDMASAVAAAREKIVEQRAKSEFAPETAHVDTRMVVSYPDNRGSEDFVWKRDIIHMS